MSEKLEFPLRRCLSFYPNQSLGFMLEQNLFLADCEDIVKDIAGYGETMSETRCKNKTVMA